MNWFFLALMAPLAWSIANYLDKFILSKSDNGEGGGGGLLILSALVSVFFAGIVLLFIGIPAIHIGSQPIGALILSGMFEALYIYFYFLALEKESTATINVLFQFTPVFGIVLAYAMLGEQVFSKQLLAIGLILIGTLLMFWKKGEKFGIRLSTFLLMIASTGFAALYDVIFKLAVDNQSFWVGVFWQYVGIGIMGLIIFVTIHEHRQEFFSLLKRQKKTALVYTGAAEVLNIVAVLVTNAAILLAPVAIVLSVSSLQPLFVYVEAIFLFAFFPTLFSDSEKPVVKPPYIIGILIVCIGSFLIYF